jgi:hypothetical protein
MKNPSNDNPSSVLKKETVFGFENGMFLGRRINVNQSTELRGRFTETSSCYTKLA